MRPSRSFLFSASVRKEDKSYVATCREEDVASQGSTPDAAVASLKEAMQLFLEDRTCYVGRAVFPGANAVRFWVHVD